MQFIKGRKIGVSPTYFISGYGTGFSCADIENELPELYKLGFNSVQFEVFERKMLKSWNSESVSEIFETAEKLGLYVSAFVAHFIGNYFAELNGSNRNAAADDMTSVLELLKTAKEIITIAVPLLPEFKGDKKEAAILLKDLSDVVSSYGRELVVEILPGSAAGAYSPFLNEQPWSDVCPEIGFLLDTGHANVTGENIPELIKRMGERLKLLHISDNDGVRNLSLKPGDGSLDWKKIIETLISTGYKGSYDLEILAEKKLLKNEYKQGREIISELLND